MTINTTQKAQALIKTGQSTDKDVNVLDTPNLGGPDKAIPTSRTASVVTGQTHLRTDLKDGPVTCRAERWGLVRYLPTLHDAGLFLAKIGGRL